MREFSDWIYDFDAEEFLFGILDHGVSLTVRVRRDALEYRWGSCDDDQIVQQAIDHFDEINNVVRTDKLPRGQLEDDGTILIRACDLLSRNESNRAFH